MLWHIFAMFSDISECVFLPKTCSIVFYWSRVFPKVRVCLSQTAALSSMGCADREKLFFMKIWKINFTLGCFYLCIPCLLLKYFLVFVLFMLVGDLECSSWITAWHFHKGVQRVVQRVLRPHFLNEVLTLPVVAVAVCQTWSRNELGKFSVGTQCSKKQIHLWALKWKLLEASFWTTCLSLLSMSVFKIQNLMQRTMRVSCYCCHWFLVVWWCCHILEKELAKEQASCEALVPVVGRA